MFLNKYIINSTVYNNDSLSKRIRFTAICFPYCVVILLCLIYTYMYNGSDYDILIPIKATTSFKLKYAVFFSLAKENRGKKFLIKTKRKE